MSGGPASHPWSESSTVPTLADIELSPRRRLRDGSTSLAASVSRRRRQSREAPVAGAPNSKRVRLDRTRSTESALTLVTDQAVASTVPPTAAPAEGRPAGASTEEQAEASRRLPRLHARAHREDSDEVEVLSASDDDYLPSGVSAAVPDFQADADGAERDDLPGPSTLRGTALGQSTPTADGTDTGTDNREIHVEGSESSDGSVAKLPTTTMSSDGNEPQPPALKDSDPRGRHPRHSDPTPVAHAESARPPMRRTRSMTSDSESRQSPYPGAEATSGSALGRSALGPAPGPKGRRSITNSVEPERRFTAAQKGKGRAAPAPNPKLASPPSEGAAKATQNEAEEKVKKEVVVDVVDIDGDSVDEPAEPPSSTSPQVDPVREISKVDPEGALSAYNCPVCFCHPTNPAVTPCGHVLCYECLHATLLAAIQRQINPYPQQPLPSASRRRPAGSLPAVQPVAWNHKTMRSAIQFDRRQKARHDAAAVGLRGADAEAFVRDQLAPEVPLDHPLKGLWRIDGDQWVIEGECPICRKPIPGGLGPLGSAIGGVILIKTRVAQRP